MHASRARGPVIDMRIWDLEPALLCDRHLLGEHRELHAIWTILTTGKDGYSHHPETRRWHGRLAALYARHEAQVAEMSRRGFRHASPLDSRLATGDAQQTEAIDSMEAQRERLASRACNCPYTTSTAPASSSTATRPVRRRPGQSTVRPAQSQGRPEPR